MDNERFEMWKDYLKTNNHLDTKFGLYSRLYYMTTENIRGLYDKTYSKIDSVLTVAGSGDQALCGIVKGATNITCFDINPFAFNQVKLKIAAVKTLSLDRFLEFFDMSFLSGFEPTFLNRRAFDIVAKELDDETISVFEYLYEIYGGNTNTIKKSIYNAFGAGYKHMRNMVNYLDEKSYAKLSYILKDGSVNIEFIESDFKNLSNVIDKKYDLISLSNISDYADNMYEGKNFLEQYHDDVMKLSDNLNDRGIMQVGYIYTKPFGYIETCPLSKSDVRDKYFDPTKFFLVDVKSYNDEEPYQYTDKIMIYKKQW